MALSRGRTRQLLRGIIDLEGGNAFGVMPGAMLDSGAFGAKLVGVYPGNFEQGKPSHQGVVVLFDRETGAPLCIADAGEITAIRTAAASAAATDVLARPDAKQLAILGYGEQAWRHVEAIRHVRILKKVTVWGRSAERAQAFAARVGTLGIEAVAASDTGSAVASADIICTLTAAAEPILFARQVPGGAHLNIVGSSRAGPAEIDTDLVVRARFFADHREGVLAQGAEFLRARQAGLIDDDHVLGEIGEVMAGSLSGRTSAGDITPYKSLGFVAQYIVSAWHIYGQLGGTRGRGK